MALLYPLQANKAVKYTFDIRLKGNMHFRHIYEKFIQLKEPYV